MLVGVQVLVLPSGQAHQTSPVSLRIGEEEEEEVAHLGVDAAAWRRERESLARHSQPPDMGSQGSPVHRMRHFRMYKTSWT